MIIKEGQKSESILPWRSILILLLAGVGAYFTWQAIQDTHEPTEVLDTILFADAEEVIDGNFIEQGIALRNGRTQDDEHAYSGKFSSYVNSENNYGISFAWKRFRPGKWYRASIMRYPADAVNAHFVVQSNISDFYIYTNKVDTIIDGWGRLTLEFMVPYDTKLNNISIFPYTLDKDTDAWFDLMKLEQMGVSHLSNEKVDSIQIYMDLKAQRKIEKKKKEALSKTILFSSSDDYVKAKLKDGDVQKDVKMRLKGDWVDHLKTDKLSYRVKMKKDEVWNRLSVFSIQSPHTRDYLSEWVFHKMLDKEDVLSPYYEFIYVTFNDELPRIYAVEEHFTKRLVESRDRREGPIIKMSEDLLWEERYESKLDLGHTDITATDGTNAKIETFDEKTVSKNEVQRKHFETARGLLNQFQNGDYERASELLDVDRFAKFFAITDILKAHHGLIWHNLRFYYNPLIQKLEPIGYDGYTENGPLSIGKLYQGIRMSNKYQVGDSPFPKLFRDVEFVQLYAQYLNQFSSKSYLDDFFGSIALEYQNRLQLLRSEYPNCNYNKNAVYNHASVINHRINRDYGKYIQAYRDNGKVYVTNYNELIAEVVGLGNGSEVDKVKPEVINSNHIYKAPEYKLVATDTLSKFLFVRDFISGGTTKVEIDNFGLPGKKSTIQKLGTELQYNQGQIECKITDSGVIVLPGSYEVSDPIIIPADKKLILSEGTIIDLKNKAFILSYGPVEIIGSQERPVVITSSDRTSMGFAVIDPAEKSTIRHARFTHLNTLQKDTYTLTGAVTFYDCEVSLEDVAVADNYCEDALNLVRCNFDITSLTISNTFGDGFDGDFCFGKVDNSLFVNTGNDALDFSGSTIEVVNTVMKGVGDKGVSVGEKSTLHVVDCSIEGAEIGLASKDLSVATLENVKLENCKIGLTAFQKKPEYGPSTINIKNVSYINVKQEQVIEENSKLQTNE